MNSVNQGQGRAIEGSTKGLPDQARLPRSCDLKVSSDGHKQ